MGMLPSGVPLLSENNAPLLEAQQVEEPDFGNLPSCQEQKLRELRVELGLWHLR